VKKAYLRVCMTGSENRMPDSDPNENGQDVFLALDDYTTQERCGYCITSSDDAYGWALMQREFPLSADQLRALIREATLCLQEISKNTLELPTLAVQSPIVARFWTKNKKSDIPISNQ